MHDLDVSPSRFRAAIGLSIAIHLCAFALLAVTVRQPADSVDASWREQQLFAVTTIVKRPIASRKRRPMAAPAVRAERPRIAAAPAAARLAPPTHLRPVAPRAAPAPGRLTLAHSAASGAALHRHPGVRSEREASRWAAGAVSADSFGTPAPTSLAATASAPQPASETPPMLTPTPMPTPTPTVAPTPRPAVAQLQNFGGLFSQNYPPALTSSGVITDVRARLAGHGRIAVDIDEQGRATAVRFPGANTAVLTTAMQDVRAALLQLSYVPADCNGLHCEGTLEIVY